MSLSTGSRLGPYEILAPLGKGGMGEVYRARDTRLERDVAIKVLPDAVRSDEALRERLLREARAISQLQHPHICALHDVGSENGVDFLVMELLDGETLAQRLARGPLPRPEALRVGIQIASALDRAHRRGIVHRDLKPGNVMLTPDGVKVLDFGLAKEVLAGAPSADSASPTALLTSEGTIVGTLHYMAPEQLEGKEVDARTDVFAFGCVLYEMLTGKRPFSGQSQASLIAALLERAPTPLVESLPDAPPAISLVIERCLDKDPERRWQSLADVRTLLEEVDALTFGTGDGAETEAPARPGRAGLAAAAVAALALAAVAGLLGRATAPSPVIEAAPIERHVVGSTGLERVSALTNALLSPDSRRIAFVGDTEQGLRLFLRDLDDLQAVEVDGSDNAGWATFSPDGEWLLYFDVIERRVEKVPIYGGPPTTVVEGYIPLSWADDDYVYYTQDSPARIGTPESKGLKRIPVQGGEPEQLTLAERGEDGRHHGHYSPQLLPDRRHVLFSVGDGYLHTNWSAAVLDLDSGDWRIVLEGANQTVQVADHLVFWRDERLWAAPFDFTTLTVSGPPRPVEDGVSKHPLAPLEVGQFRVNRRGDLIYVGGSTIEGYGAAVVAIDREGETRDLLVYDDGDRVGAPSRSPRGDLLVFEHCSGYDGDGLSCGVEVLDPASGEVRRLDNRVNLATDPIWNADGTAVIYSMSETLRGGMRLLVSQKLDGSPAREIWRSEQESAVASAALDPETLVVNLGRPQEAEVALLRDGQAQTLLPPSPWQFATDVSPDRRWLVGQSRRNGQFQLWLLDLDAPDAGPRQLTRDGGLFAYFGPEGRSLYYRSAAYPGPAEIVRADFDPELGRMGEPSTVTSTRGQNSSSWWLLGGFDVTEGGIVQSELRSPAGGGQIVLVQNWARELERRLAEE